jgi:endogenous inhibitor of DNA gyrase (YacG/DUF329 family)
MATLMIKCPVTGKPAPTGMSLDKKAFDSTTLKDNLINCPHCKKMHAWSKKDVLPFS